MNYYIPTPVVLLILVALQAGCIIPFTHEPRFKPDPLEKQAVQIVAVSGRTVTLSDGRAFEVAGLDDQELTTTQRADLEKLLRQDSFFPVLVDDLGNGKARLIRLQVYLYHLYHPWFESLAIRVCVIHDDVYPNRVDLGLWAAQAGLAAVRANELAGAHDLPPTAHDQQFYDPGSAAAERYRTANEAAQRSRIGIYRPPPDPDSSVNLSPVATQPGPQ